jgi:hypothetical protein
VAFFKASVSRSGTRPHRKAVALFTPGSSGCRRFPAGGVLALKASSWQRVVVPAGGFDRGLPGRSGPSSLSVDEVYRKGFILAAVAPT